MKEFHLKKLQILSGLQNAFQNCDMLYCFEAAAPNVVHGAVFVIYIVFKFLKNRTELIFGGQFFKLFFSSFQ